MKNIFLSNTKHCSSLKHFNSFVAFYQVFIIFSLRMHPLLFVFILSFRVVINFTSKYLSRQYCLTRQIVTFLISAGDRAEEEVAHKKDCLDHPLVDIYFMMKCLFVCL